MPADGWSPGVPGWARDLVAAACADAGVAPPARLAWRRRARPHSTGVTRWRERAISISAGTDPGDLRLTLLHELAHWTGAAPGRRRGGRAEHHGRAFYARAFALYRRHGVPDPTALAGEAARYPGSLRHAAALGVPGAGEALAARRAMQRARPRGRWEVRVAEHAIRLERDGRWTVCGVCRQRIVGPLLARLRRRRTPGRHVLLARA